MDGDDADDRAGPVFIIDVGAVGHGCSTRPTRCRCEGVPIYRKSAGRWFPPHAFCARWFCVQPLLLLRPPPWLALPPLLAISRCLAGSIAANPRFAPVLLVDAISTLHTSGLVSEERDRQSP